MCLDKLATRKDAKFFRYKKEDGEVIGYRVFNVVQGLLFSFYYPSRYLPTGKWIDEGTYRQPMKRKRKTIETENFERYPMGWHVFINEEDALQLGLPQVRKVSLRNIRRRGFENIMNVFTGKIHRTPVVITQFIKIHPEENEQGKRP